MTLAGFNIDDYYSRGYSGPCRLLRAVHVDCIRDEIEKKVLTSDGPYLKNRCESRHQDNRTIYDLVTNSHILDAIGEVIGPDLILWNTVIFNKESGAGEIPWHQDREFLLLQPVINAAVWIAIDQCASENGCLEVIPGSHLTGIPHLPRRSEYEFPARANLNYVDKSRAVKLELEPGQCVVFHPMILHRSAANLSMSRRMGVVARFTVPGVDVIHTRLFHNHKVFVVRGRDKVGLNEIGVPPQ